jgi:hypothetical protein
MVANVRVKRSKRHCDRAVDVPSTRAQSSCRTCRRARPSTWGCTATPCCCSARSVR